LITLNNLRIFLLAIMGTFVEPTGLIKSEQKLQRLSAYGHFNEQGDLFLEIDEVPRV